MKANVHKTTEIYDVVLDKETINNHNFIGKLYHDLESDLWVGKMEINEKGNIEDDSHGFSEEQFDNQEEAFNWVMERAELIASDL